MKRSLGVATVMRSLAEKSLLEKTAPLNATAAA